MDDIFYRIRIQKIMESEGIPSRGPAKKYEIDLTKAELDEFFAKCKCHVLADGRNLGRPPFNVIICGEGGCRCKIMVTVVQKLTPVPEERTPKMVQDRDGSVISYDEWLAKRKSHER